MSATTPHVWVVAGAERSYIDGPDGAPVWLDTPAWFTWLAAATTTRFAYPLCDLAHGYSVGVMTVRKERRTRGGAYWIVYRRAGGHLYKVYLGRAPLVTQGRLAAIAHAFLAPTGEQ